MKWFDVRFATLEEAEDFQFQLGTFQNKAKKRNQHNELIISTPKKTSPPPNRSSGVPVASIFANLLKGKLFALVRRFQSYQVLIQLDSTISSPKLRYPREKAVFKDDFQFSQGGIC